MGLEWLLKIHHEKYLVLMDEFIRPNSISTRIVHKIDDGWRLPVKLRVEVIIGILQRHDCNITRSRRKSKFQMRLAPVFIRTKIWASVLAFKPVKHFDCKRPPNLLAALTYHEAFWSKASRKRPPAGRKSCKKRKRLLSSEDLDGRARKTLMKCQIIKANLTSL